MKKQIQEVYELIKATEDYLDQLYDYFEIMVMAEKVEKAVMRYEGKYGEEEVKPMDSETLVSIGKVVSQDRFGDDDFFHSIFSR